MIVERLGCPLVTASLKSDDETEYLTDPELIHERYGRDVALVVDGGPGSLVPTTGRRPHAGGARNRAAGRRGTQMTEPML